MPSEKFFRYSASADHNTNQIQIPVDEEHDYSFLIYGAGTANAFIYGYFNSLSGNYRTARWRGQGTGAASVTQTNNTTVGLEVGRTNPNFPTFAELKIFGTRANQITVRKRSIHGSAANASIDHNSNSWMTTNQPLETFTFYTTTTDVSYITIIGFRYPKNGNQGAWQREGQTIIAGSAPVTFSGLDGDKFRWIKQKAVNPLNPDQDRAHYQTNMNTITSQHRRQDYIAQGNGVNTGSGTFQPYFFSIAHGEFFLHATSGKQRVGMSYGQMRQGDGGLVLGCAENCSKQQNTGANITSIATGSELGAPDVFDTMVYYQVYNPRAAWSEMPWELVKSFDLFNEFGVVDFDNLKGNQVFAYRVEIDVTIAVPSADAFITINHDGEAGSYHSQRLHNATNLQSVAQEEPNRTAFFVDSCRSTVNNMMDFMFFPEQGRIRNYIGEYKFFEGGSATNRLEGGFYRGPDVEVTSIQAGPFVNVIGSIRLYRILK